MKGAFLFKALPAWVGILSYHQQAAEWRIDYFPFISSIRLKAAFTMPFKQELFMMSSRADFTVVLNHGGQGGRWGRHGNMTAI